jgi:caa(3)-type oxidase subunit IV
VGTNTTVNYKEEKAVYYKVLIGLLLLTAVTFVQPHLFMTHSTFLAQMLIAVIKAWLIVIYYMHLKGEKLIGAMVIFALLLVLVFFVIVIGVDVSHFQFKGESYITEPITTGAAHSATPAHH